jgi:glycosyltransferase involved in cell wall biosynthesis
MKISILISSYNKGKYLKQCIESCCQQDTDDFEIILFDNFSSDETDEILEEFSEKINFYKNNRISKYSAINQIDLLKRGFSKSSGEIICLLDADDYFKINKIKKIRDFFEKNETKNIVFDLPIIKKGKIEKNFKFRKKLTNNLWSTIIPTSSISFRRDFFEELIKNNLLEKYDLLEIDFRINVYANVIKDELNLLNDSLNVYMQTENSIMSNHKKFSPYWWKRRLQAHKFMKEVYLIKNMSYYNIDFFFTKILVNIFNFLKL